MIALEHLEGTEIHFKLTQSIKGEMQVEMVKQERNWPSATI